MHRKLFIKIILMSFLFIGIVHAQTPKWVSTEVQKRNVVFEHFTGTSYMGFPMGDKEANTLAKEFSNVYYIDMHNLETKHYAFGDGLHYGKIFYDNYLK